MKSADELRTAQEERLPGRSWFSFWEIGAQVAMAGAPPVLVVIDGLFLFFATIVASSLDLWKLATLKSFSVYSARGYVFVGGIVAFAMGAKWLLSLAKEISKECFTDLEAQAAAAHRERDVALSCEALIGAVVHAKILAAC